MLFLSFNGYSQSTHSSLVKKQAIVFGYFGPGGVGSVNGTSDLSLWLQANRITGLNNGDPVSNWNDDSGSTHSAVQGIAAYQGSMNENQLNSYPTIQFDGENDFYDTGYIPVLGNASRTIFSVITNGSNNPYNGYRHIVHYGQYSHNRAYGLAFKTYIPQTGATSNIGNHYWENGFSGTVPYSADSFILNLSYDGTKDELFVNGEFKGSRAINLNTGNSVNLLIGSRIGGPSETFKGDVAEVIIYNTKLTLVERIIVENYLSSKYDISLSKNDFYTQDDSNINFDHDVAGIGQASDGTNHTDSQGTGIIRINNPSSLANGDFLFWGRNNKGTHSFNTNASTHTERISSTWRVSKRNNLGEVSLEIDLSSVDISGKQDCADLQLIVDNDSDFSSLTQRYNLINVSGDVYRVDGVSFSDNDYFTIEYVDKIVLDGTQFYNGSGVSSAPNHLDSCYKLLIKNTATGFLTLTGDATVRELEIEASGKLVIESGRKLEVINGILLNGDLRLTGTSQLLQLHDGTTQVSGGGKLLVDQEGTTTNVYQSSYWTSPVSTNGSIFSIADVLKDGTILTSASSVPQDINFTDSQILDGSKTTPITISGRWLAKLISTVDWTREIDPTEMIFKPGEGWNMKSTGSGIQNFTFKGIPNDGVYTSIISQNTLSLIGNPYPSALDSDKFIADNSSVITGTLYFYDSKNDVSHSRESYAGGYATRVSGLGTPFNGGVIPGKYIPIGQGFFVTRDVADVGTITFKNSQRAFQVRGNNSPFLSKENKQRDSSLPIFRLGFEFDVNSKQKYHRQLAVAFRGVTANYEEGMDAEMFDRKPTDIALKVNDRTSPFVITGVENFDKKLEIPLLLYLDRNRKVTFLIDGLENLDTNVYLKDLVNNQYYDLSNAVSINLLKGSYSDRFLIVFQNRTLAEEELQLLSLVEFFLEKHTQELVIKNRNSSLEIEEVKIFSMLGEELLRLKKNNFDKILNRISLAFLIDGIYIIKLKTNRGSISKKIVFTR